ncbi:MAG TPA: hypothetical protein DF699_06345 [Phycisphaerales bacterium]|nr:hypothetical protein [Phycisphaerales bacterium]
MCHLQAMRKAIILSPWEAPVQTRLNSAQLGSTRLDSLRTTVAYFLATLLILATFAKIYSPNETLETIRALGGFISMESDAVAKGVFALVVAVEWVIGVSVFLFMGCRVPRVALFGIYAAFTVATLTLLVWSPETGCGCAVLGGDTVSASTAGKSFALLGLAACQLPDMDIRRTSRRAFSENQDTQLRGVS